VANLDARLNKLYTKVWTTKRWRNVGQFCDRKYHPFVWTYRVYRRGKNRCSYCGAKIGKRELVRDSPREQLVDSIYYTSPMFDMLKKKGKVSG